MKRILSSINKRSSPSLDTAANYPGDSPENTVIREVNAFCNAGSTPDNAGSEYIHLPSIVESAESSANAAREAAHLLRKLLSNPSSGPGNIQYNAIMLVRILIDNPGHTFSRNIDAKFVSTVKELLREGRDMHVQRFLRETLDSLEVQRAWDEDLVLLLQMWAKEKSKMEKLARSKSWTGSWPRASQNQTPSYPPNPSHQPQQRTDGLPAPDELAARVSEAKMTAKLLIQCVQSTPPSEMLSNELITEFSGRCRRASRAMQNYIHATNPAPDEDTLLTLIETNDELSVALSKHQRAMLQARKMAQQTEHPEPLPQQQEQEPSSEPDSNRALGTDLSSLSGTLHSAPPIPPPRSQTPPSPISPAVTATRSMTTRTAHSDVSSASGSGNNIGGRYEYRSEDYQVQNPFADNFSIPPSMPAHAEEPADRIDERDRWNDASQQRPVQQT